MRTVDHDTKASLAVSMTGGTDVSGERKTASGGKDGHHRASVERKD
jgi:hypothetical protein